MSITSRTAERLTGGDPDAAPNTFVRDTGLPGFAILVGRSKASYVVESRAGRHGRNIRVTLGTVGKLTLDDARRLAKDTLARLARGEDVVAASRAAAARSITVGQALDNLVADRKLKSVDDYRRSIDSLGWAELPLASITPDIVAKRYREMPGKTAAARCFAVFRSIWRHARESGADLGESPTSRLRTVNRSWAQTRRRTRMIPDALMPAWRAAVEQIKSEDMRDLVLVTLYTGCRISEAQALTAADISLEAGALRFATPKNRQPLDLPIVRQLEPVLTRRVAAAPEGPVFCCSLSLYWLEGTRKVCRWSWHDLRRLYITSAHRAGTDPEVARALVNHAAPAASDAHSGYVVLGPDAMRADAQRVADFLDRLGR